MKSGRYNIFRAVTLVIGHLLGRLSGEEQQEYADLLQETGLKEADWAGDVLKRELSSTDARFDARQAYKRFRLHAFRRMALRKQRMQMAAACLIPLLMAAGGVFIWLSRHSPQTTGNPIPPVESKAFIELADGSSIALAALPQGELAEQDGTVIEQDSGKLVYVQNRIPPNDERVLYNTLHVPRGGEYMLQLADGTRVWVNSDSRLRYPVQFTAKTRDVFLEGEAYFEVSRREQHPFVVHTSAGKVHVLGTAFNVHDYAEEPAVVTTLVHGKVEYVGRHGSRAALIPGHQVIDRKGGDQLIVQPVNTEEYTGWKDGLCIFYNYSLEQIMQIIGRSYDVEVSYETDRLKALRFTGELKRYGDVRDFLRFIETGGDVAFVVKEKHIYCKVKSK